MIGDADKGLRQLRKDAGKLVKWGKKKYKQRKIKKMKVKGKL